MPHYEMRYLTREGEEAEKISFDAQDWSKALAVAREHGGAETAELWQGGEKLCFLSRWPDGRDEVWVVTGSSYGCPSTKEGLAVGAQH